MHSSKTILRACRGLPYRRLASMTTYELPALVLPTSFLNTIPSPRPTSQTLQRVSYATNANTDSGAPSDGQNARLAHALSESNASDLVSEVRIPSDPDGILQSDHPAITILGNSSLVIQRQLEMMNVLIGVEQANRYIIMDGQGNTVGYLAERDHGIGRALVRQAARTHRSFTAHIFDTDQREVLRIHRPFSYISSRIRIYDPLADGDSNAGTLQSLSSEPAAAQVSSLDLKSMRIIGEAQQRWSPLRRKYELYHFRRNSQKLLSETGAATENSTAVTKSETRDAAIESGMAQFAAIDEPMLSWDFTAKEEDGRVIASINRNFSGFAREIFTDTGVYALRMDAAAQTSALETADGQEIARYEIPALTLDQRAVMIATAVSVDFDFFSRHSHSGPGFMPMYVPMGGGTAAEGGAVGVGAAGGAAAGEAGVGVMGGAAGEMGTGAIGSAAGAAGRSAAGAGAIESGIAGAGTMAGYEAMQRGVYGQQGDDASPQSAEPPPTSGSIQENQPGQDDVWGVDQDPWNESAGDVQPDAGEGGGLLSTILEWFSDS